MLHLGTLQPVGQLGADPAPGRIHHRQVRPVASLGGEVRGVADGEGHLVCQAGFRSTAPGAGDGLVADLDPGHHASRRGQVQRETAHPAVQVP